ncbi:VOC family protein [Cellulomonas soli]|uniref:Putative 3-demethylubiquinone-9 3-methyltransferase n=1 Tax=Cellulomonas soli TaxID=931535 RepID=A0A512P8R1_9CELL|nr:VOC family protein [Cellulomonas soli]NYI57804.1 putative 3-demethylubiquinone-9 3-methyltransferase (glyoxalase superfamily) [Cellulomonas soli]GEP67588.1 putative 3-demethylubiquinone-9 3-methyltransferase [Cellulomonas soli]
MGIVRPHLWFDDQAEQAADFYVSVLPRSEVTNVVRAPAGVPGVPEGQAFVVEAVLDGQHVTLMNGGPTFQLDEAFSFVIDCQDQAEVDHYWDALLAGGGEPSRCGWLKDRFGLSWQVVPVALDRLLFGTGGDPEGSARAMAAMMPMTKLDIAALQAAYDGL